MDADSIGGAVNLKSKSALDRKTRRTTYQLGGSFNATQFYSDIEGHPEERNVRLALEELQFFTSHMRVLGVYPAHIYRKSMVP